MVKSKNFEKQKKNSAIGLEITKGQWDNLKYQLILNLICTCKCYVCTDTVSFDSH